MQENTDERIIILTAPSGAGKTSITRYLLGRFPDRLCFSVSATTRQPRNNEKEGKDYYYMSVEAFLQKIRDNEFVEWEMVYQGKYYGTLKSEMERIWQSGRMPVLDIDVKGAIHVQQQFQGQTLSLFIEPPNLEELQKRLIARGSETENSLEDRLNKASYEISFKKHFDRVIVNDQLDRACHEAEEVVSRYLHDA